MGTGGGNLVGEDASSYGLLLFVKYPGVSVCTVEKFFGDAGPEGTRCAGEELEVPSLDSGETLREKFVTGAFRPLWA